ncbi:MAG: hypothetical protein J6V65_03920 [Fibrobacterales bacterium]|nr:hypothetical protein [Fibrobacterales bacterium]
MERRKFADVVLAIRRKAAELKSRSARKATELTSRAASKAVKTVSFSAWQYFRLSCKIKLFAAKTGLCLALATFYGVIPPKEKKKTEEGVVCRFIRKRIEQLEHKERRGGRLDPSDGKELEYLRQELSSGAHRVTEEENEAFLQYVESTAAERLIWVTSFAALGFVVYLLV